MVRTLEDKDLGEIDISKWWNVTLAGNIFGKGRRAVPGRLNVAGASVWTLRGVNVLRKLLGNLNSCHHPDTGQILITTKTNRPRLLQYHHTYSVF